MFLNVSYWTAFTAGVVSFFSPCLLPLIPAYIMYLAGSFDAEEISHKKRLVLWQTAGFIVGFTLVFMIMGVTASALGKLFASHKVILSQISGLAIIFFGVYSLGFINIKALSRDYRRTKAHGKVNFFTAIAMGMAFAFGWTPCFGPILGAILASTAAMSSNVSDGVKLLFTYSMGMAVPFMITALFINTIEKYTQGLSKHAKTINRITGVLMIVLGLLIFTGNLGPIVNKLLELL